MGARSDSIRCQLFPPMEIARRFEAFAGAQGASKSTLLVAALVAFLERRGASKIEQRFATRLDWISGQPDRIERNEIARAIGRDRFAAFIARVGRQLASGTRTFDPKDAAGGAP